MKKEMVNRKTLWGMVILAFGLVLTGCVTVGTATEVSTNTGNFGGHTRTPVKDFQSMGLVFTETTLTTTEGGSDEGRIFTYQELLKEAHTRGADAIINVVIDKRIQVSTFPSSRSTTWYGSALAIKYTTTLTETGSVTVTSGGGGTTTVTTSVYFNDGGALDTGGKAEAPSAGGRPPVPTPAPARSLRQ